MLPALLTGGRMAMQALPYITAVMGAIPGLTKGDLGQAALGGGLGYLGGGFGASKLGGARTAATAGLRGVAQGTGPLASLAGGLKPIAQIGIPLAGAAVAAPLIGGLASGTGGAVSRNAGAAARNVIGAAGAMGVGRPDPSGEFTLPYDVTAEVERRALAGLPTTADVMDVNKFYAASRANAELEALTQLKNLKLIEPYKFQAAEAAKLNEFKRQAAGAQIRQNIDTAAAMIQRGQQATQQMGQTAAQQIGQALISQYQYV
jgi:hypothetical protein